MRAALFLALAAFASLAAAGNRPPPIEIPVAAGGNLRSAAVNPTYGDPIKIEHPHPLRNVTLAQSGSGRKLLATPQLTYHGGPVMTNSIKVYMIYLGGATTSSSSMVPSWMNWLVSKISATTYMNINKLYGPSSGCPSCATKYNGGMTLAGTAYINTASTAFPAAYKNMNSDATIANIIKWAIANGKVATNDVPNSIYILVPLQGFGLTMQPGFCSKWCGWHTGMSYNGQQLKYGYIPQPTADCSCRVSNTGSPSGDGGVDGMQSVLAHELFEAQSDPWINAWYDVNGDENADKCAWNFGTVYKTTSAQPIGAGFNYNILIGNYPYMIQKQWSIAKTSAGVQMGCVMSA